MEASLESNNGAHQIFVKVLLPDFLAIVIDAAWLCKNIVLVLLHHLGTMRNRPEMTREMDSLPELHV